MDFSFWTFFSYLSRRPLYQLFPQPPSFFTTAVGSFAPCLSQTRMYSLRLMQQHPWSSRTRDTDAEEGRNHNISPRGEILQITAPQCPEDTWNHWGRGVRVTTLSSTGALSIDTLFTITLARLPATLLLPACSPVFYSLDPSFVAIFPLEPKD